MQSTCSIIRFKAYLLINNNETLWRYIDLLELPDSYECAKTLIIQRLDLDRRQQFCDAEESNLYNIYDLPRESEYWSMPVIFGRYEYFESL